MNIKFLCILFFALVSCNTTEPINLNDIEGYWEIKSVDTPDNPDKNYKVNTLISFITLTSDSTAVRQKLIPTITGRYVETGTQELLNLTTYEDSIVVHSKTKFASHNEVITKLKDSIMAIRINNSVYSYKRFTPISF